MAQNKGDAEAFEALYYRYRDWVYRLAWRFTGDREFRTRVLTQAVSLLDDYAEVGLKRREPISEIHVEDDGGFSIYSGPDAVHVALGTPPFRSKLRRLRKVLDRLERKKARPAYVYLDNDRRPDRVTVRLR